MSDSTVDAPLVAIVTPVFNGGKYLVETMECVQALSYPNLVHLVHDNCSADDTASIIDQFRGRRVPVVSKRSAMVVPMAQNWNAAVRAIPEEAAYFWLLCADDLLVPDAIEKAVRVAEGDATVNVVGCRWTGDSLCGTELAVDKSVFDGKEVMRKYLRRETMVLSGMNVLYRVRGLDRPSEFYDGTFASFDADATLRMLLYGNYGFVHEELLFWRQHPDSTWSTFGSKHLDYAADWLILLDRYGPYVLGHREYLSCRRAYRNYLIRRLLVSRWRHGNLEEYSSCMNELDAHDDHVGALDFVGAIVDWGSYAIRGRRDEIGSPRRRPAAVKGGGVVVRRSRI
jgi:glycosyltransferase involved in cell wall biosynthesis